MGRSRKPLGALRPLGSNPSLSAIENRSILTWPRQYACVAKQRFSSAFLAHKIASWGAMMSGISGKTRNARTEKLTKALVQVKAFLEKVLGVSSCRVPCLSHRVKRRLPGAVAMTVLDASGPDEIVTHSLREILDATGMAGGMILLREEVHEPMSLVCQQGLPQKLVGEAASRLPEDEMIRTVCRTRRPVCVADLTLFPGGRAGRWMDHGYRSFVAVPIALDGRLLGVIGLVDERRLRFGGAALERLGSAGSLIARAIEKARDHKEMADAFVTMRRLNRARGEIVLPAHGDEHLDELARVVCDAALALSSMITLVCEDGRVLRRKTFGYTRGALAAASRTDAISTRCLRTKECVIVSEPAEGAQALGTDVTESRFGSSICLPLRVGDRGLGTLWLNYEAPRDFAAWEIEQLQALADRVAIAIEDARQRTEAVERAEQYKHLHTHFQAISSPTNLDGILQAMADSARDLLKANIAVASLAGPDGPRQAISPRHEDSPKDRKGMAFPSAEGSDIAEKLRSFGESAGSAAAGVEQCPSLRLQGLLAVRLVDEERKPAGLLMVGDRRHDGEFSKEDEDLLSLLARRGMLAIEDVHSRLRTEHRIEQYRALLDSVPMAVAELNEAQVVIATNTAFEALTGFAREEAEGKMRLSDLFPAMERDDHSKTWEQGPDASPDAPPIDAALVTKKGDTKQVRVFPGEAHSGGRRTLCLTEMHDEEGPGEVSEREKAAELGRIALGLLADLRPSLFASGSHLDQLVRHELPGDAHETLEAISDEVTACQRTLEAFEIVSEPTPPAREPLNLNDLVTSIVDKKAASLRRDNISVTLRLEAGFPTLSADPGQVSWMLAGLIDNARKAMRESDGERSLSIQTDSSGRVGSLTISDRRPRASAGELGSLLETSEGDGKRLSQQGLFVAACRSIIEGHGWQLSGESYGEQGLTLAIDVPLPEAPVQASEPDIAVPTEEAPLEPAEVQPEVKRVLVADDEGVVIDLLDYYLRSEGHSVEVSRDGRAALNKLKENDYDLIFCDVRMPQLSGQELFQWIEANKPILAERVIFITGDVATPETLSFLNDPPKRWLEKPFDLTELRQMIAGVLR